MKFNYHPGTDVIGKVFMCAMLTALVASVFLICCTPCRSCKNDQTITSASAAWDINTQYSLLGKCMNLGNALEAPVEGAWGVVLKDAYFSHVKSLGFQSVRIPVRWSAHVDTASPYTINETFMNRVIWAVDQARANNLRAIINVHHFEDLMSNPEKFSPVFLSIWEQVAKRFSAYGPELYFELCNEPNGSVSSTLWNNLAKQALSIVRQSNPFRSVIIGPTSWNSAKGLPDLALPADSFLIATFHCYDPMVFTHQCASWTIGSELWKGTRWRASRGDTSILISSFNDVAAWSAKNHVPVFLGEFGSIDTADSVSRTLYTSFIAKQAVKRGWAYAYWKYNGNFGIYDDSTNTTRRYLIDALLKPESTFTACLLAAAADTTVTPATGSEKYLLLDDFDDTLPRQNSLVSVKPLLSDTSFQPLSSCFWSTWFNDPSLITDMNRNRIFAGNSNSNQLAGPWGKTGNGLYAKAYLQGGNYPTINLSTAFSIYNKDWFDLSPLTAISFHAKGYGIWTIDIITDTIQNGYGPSDNWGHFSCTFEPDSGWKLFVVPVESLKPKAWSKAQQQMLPWSAGMKRACAVTFCTSHKYGSQVNDSLEIFLDDIRLYGLSSDELKKPEK